MFIEVHKYDGKPAMVWVGNITYFESDPQLETKSVIHFTNGVLYVQESIHEILDLMVQTSLGL